MVVSKSQTPRLTDEELRKKIQANVVKKAGTWKGYPLRKGDVWYHPSL